jgi:hypothetical protein
VHYVNDPDTFILQAVKTADVICFLVQMKVLTITLIDTKRQIKFIYYTVSGQHRVQELLPLQV